MGIMNFASDNWAGVSDKISEAIAEASAGLAPAYGNDDLTAEVERQFCELFERDVAVFFVATGSAANSLALSSVTPPGGVIFCHRDAHIAVDECGGPEFFSAGGKLFTIPGTTGKLKPETLQVAFERFPEGVVHHGQAAAVSLSQATESGTAYGLDEISAIADVARERGLSVHMDGARFANALVSLSATPAEMTWKAGVDMLSFGGTKNGCWCAEAVILFDPGKSDAFGYIRKRAGHLFSKSRFVAAQFNAYLKDGHWLELARHANKMAVRLASGLANAPSTRLAWQSQSNEVFAIMPEAHISRLRDAGAVFHPWPSEMDAANGGPDSGETLVRLVTSFRTTDGEINRFLEAVTAPTN